MARKRIAIDTGAIAPDRVNGRRVKVRLDRKRIAMHLRKATFTSLSKAAAVIRRIAQASIKQSPKDEPSPPGKPPRTRHGQLKKSIRYVVDKEAGTMVVGPARSEIALVGAVHEHGRTVPGESRTVGVYRYGKLVGTEVKQIPAKPYPKREFMRPAFEKVRDRLPEFWANSFVEG